MRYKALTIILSISGFVILIALVLNNKTSFDKEEKIIEVITDEDYTYMVTNYSKKFAMIVGLTENGKTKKVLHIPSKIKDYEVNQLGSTRLITKSHRYDNAFISRNLEKIIGDSYFSISNGFLDKCPNLKKIIVFHDANYNSLHEVKPKTGPYSPIDIYQINPTSGRTENKKYKTPNLIFYINEDSPYDKAYAIDDYDNESKIEKPVDPVRKGYTFLGWYKEKECTTPWDFDKDTISKKEYIDGEYQYSLTKLYAKWGN